MKLGSSRDSSMTSSAVDWLCSDPQSTCCQELDGVAQGFLYSPQLDLVVEASTSRAQDPRVRIPVALDFVGVETYQ